jgi:hypothetical protein
MQTPIPQLHILGGSPKKNFAHLYIGCARVRGLSHACVEVAPTRQLLDHRLEAFAKGSGWSLFSTLSTA